MGPTPNAIGQSESPNRCLQIKTFPMLLWLKALHIVVVISWMAGMLYLPRLLVYHAEAPKGSAASETFKLMEQRLLRGIMNPSIILVS